MLKPFNLLVAAVAILSAASLGVAQRPISSLLPETTVFALHASPDGYDPAVLEDLFDELDLAAAGEVLGRLGLALTDAAESEGAGVAELQADVFGDLEAQCPELTTVLERLHDSFGPTAGGVSMSRFDPVPAVVFATRPGDDTVAGDLTAAVVGCFEGERIGAEGDSDLFVVGDGTEMPLVVAHSGGTFIVSSDPEQLRGALRRAAGAGGPSLATTRIGALSEGMTSRGLGITVNLAAVADALQLYGGVVADDPSVAPLFDRLITTLRVASGFAWHATVDGGGVLVESVAAYDSRLAEEAGEEALIEMLTCSSCRIGEPTLMPRDATSLSGGTFDLNATIAWLDSWLADAAEAGAFHGRDVRSVVGEVLGVDPDDALLGWLGDSWHAATLDVLSTDVRPWLQGLPTVIAMPVTSEEEARRGVDLWLEALANLGDLTASSDEVNEALGGEDFRIDEAVSVRERSYRGTDYLRVRTGPTVDLGIAVFGGHLVVGWPAASLHESIDTFLGDPAAEESAWRIYDGLAVDQAGILAYEVTDTPRFLQGLVEISDLAAGSVASALWLGVQGAAAMDDLGGAESEGPADRDTTDLPTFDDMLGLADVVTEALSVLAERTGAAVGTTELRNGARWSTWRLPLR